MKERATIMARAMSLRFNWYTCESEHIVSALVDYSSVSGKNIEPDDHPYYHRIAKADLDACRTPEELVELVCVAVREVLLRAKP